jgi:predicted nucleic acid-binding protein
VTLYVDSSAFARRYVSSEPEHAECVAIMNADREWVTSRLTDAETSRALNRAKGPVGAADFLSEFGADLMFAWLVEIDRTTIAMAREVSAQTGSKSLDAIHIATALRVDTPRVRFLTYDRQQARAAEQLGLTLAR